MKQVWTIPNMTNEVLMLGFQSEGGEGLNKLHLLLPSWAGQDHAWWGLHNHHYMWLGYHSYPCRDSCESNVILNPMSYF